MRLERLELVVGIVRAEEDRLVIIERDGERGEREGGNVPGKGVPVAGVVELQFPENCGAARLRKKSLAINLSFWL